MGRECDVRDKSEGRASALPLTCRHRKCQHLPIVPALVQFPCLAPTPRLDHNVPKKHKKPLRPAELP
jgi:hypothetical protein